MRKSTFLALVALVGLLTLSQEAFATPVISSTGVICTTNNTPANCAAMSAQVTLDVDFTPGFADFTISNTGLLPSVVTQVYWSDLTPFLTGPAILQSFTGVVNMTAPGAGGACSPDHVPGTLNTWNYCVEATPPPSSNGINNGVPGESATFRFVYGGDIPTLAGALASGQILVGLHVQSFSNGLSEGGIFTFGEGDVPQVPEPGTWVLFGSGVGLLVLARLRRRRGPDFTSRQ